MSRLSIEITPQQHQQIKALAAMHGTSIKDYILERTIPSDTPWTDDERAALRELEALLQPRLDAAERGEVSNKSVMDVFHEVCARMDAEG